MAAAVRKGGSSRGESAKQAAKARREKMIAIGGGALLLVLLAIQGPGILKQLSGGSSAQAPLPAAATAIARPAVAARAARTAATPASLRRFTAKDPFVPQITVASAPGAGAAGGMKLATGPKVRAKSFVVKDPFEPQIALPTGATPATPVTNTGAVGEGATITPNASADTGTFVVVIALIPARNGAKAAARAVVAARNAGLKDVVLTPPSRKGKGHYIVSTGPYPSSTSAYSELVRALRNGYPAAYTRKLASTQGAGF